MSKPEVSKLHLRHCMLFLFDMGMNATQATKDIVETYGPVTTTNRCQFWFRRFRSGDRCLEDLPKSGRPSTLDDDQLRTLVESDPGQSIGDLSQKLAIPWSTVQGHLKKIGKTISTNTKTEDRVNKKKKKSKN